MDDSAMSVNTTTSIDSPCRRLVGSSTSRSRFRTQAHHLRQALARYPFIHSEKFDLCLLPTETQLPPRGPDAECGTTWVHIMVGVYAPVRLLHIGPPPSSLQIYQTSGAMGYGSTTTTRYVRPRSARRKNAFECHELTCNNDSVSVRAMYWGCSVELPSVFVWFLRE